VTAQPDRFECGRRTCPAAPEKIFKDKTRDKAARQKGDGTGTHRKKYGHRRAAEKAAAVRLWPVLRNL